MISIIISVILIAVTVIIDQATKYWMVDIFNFWEYIGLDFATAYGATKNLEPIEIIPGIFDFKFTLNNAAAMGIFEDERWLFMSVSTVTIIAVLVYMFWKKPQNKLFLASLILITGGGIGNMIDRIFLGYVIDFIDFCAFPSIWKYIFNFADACVCVGAGLLMLYTILSAIEEAKAEKALKAANSEKEIAEDGE